MWLAVTILSTMILVLLGSFLVKWPELPIDPSTIAGAMYYAVMDDTTSPEMMPSPSPSQRAPRQEDADV